MARKPIRVYLGVKTYEVFLCFVAIVEVKVYYVDFSAFFVYVAGDCHRFLHRGYLPAQGWSV